jgi:predicted nucleic acid-binding protein
MHAKFEELLSIRDSTPVAAATTEHFSGCCHCQRVLERLHSLKNELGDLPQYAPPPRVWLGILEDLERPEVNRPNRGWLMATATALSTAVVALAIIAPLHVRDSHQPADGDEQTLGTLVTRSQRLEEILQNLPRRPTVQRAATSAAIEDLQSRIQVLDLQLTEVADAADDRARINQLWSARVQLLNSLVYVRYAESFREGIGFMSSASLGAI